MSAWWPSTSRHRGLLIAILLLGLAIRLLLWWRTPIHQPANDEVEYLTVARDLLAGRGWVFYESYHWLRAPLYPLWLAASLWLAGGDLHLAALPNIALSSATIYLYYLLGREVGQSRRSTLPISDPRSPIPDRTGLLSAALAAVLLTFSTFASLWMSETLFTALFVAALIALLRWSACPRWRLVAVAGALFSLAVLTRSMPLAALPLFACWMLGVGYWARGLRIGNWTWGLRIGGREAYQDRVVAQPSLKPQTSRLMPPLFFVLCSVIVIAPWTIRNYRAYDAFLPVETGLSYNLWAFNEPREDQATIFRTLESIRNPAERADYATAKGLERLREDPAIALRKLDPNWASLWQINPIQDRFLQETYYGDVPLGMFAAALLLDDALYMALAVAGLIGLIFTPLDRRKLLLGGWLLYVIAVVLATHGEGRYRHFIFPVLLPYAALLIGDWREMLHLSQRSLLARSAVIMIVLALLWRPVVMQYPYDWAATNLQRGWAVQQAEWAARRGDIERVIAFYDRAAAIDPGSADVWLQRGRLLQRHGQDEQALAAFEQGWQIEPSYVAANVLRGDALRRLGRDDEAREAFRGFYTDERDMLRWAWDELGSPSPSTLAVGDGLDFGFVDGMYAAEQQADRVARWTGAEATLRLAGSDRGGVLRLTLAAPRPQNERVPVQVCVATVCQSVLVGGEWREIAFLAPPSARYDVRISAPTFDPQAIDPQSTDTRSLGVLVDHALVDALPGS